MFPSEYTLKTKIASYHAGEGRRLTLSSQLKLQQEVGELQLEAGGLPYSKLWDNGMVFVLTRAASIIYRAPLFEEEIALTTWSKGPKGSQYFRCYRFCDKSGAVLIDSVSAFAMVDPVNHRLKRPSEFETLGISHMRERENSCEDPGKIKLPQNIGNLQERVVRYSDIDYNGHLNNTVYADLICDYMPGGMQGKRIERFQIVFSGEAKLSDTIRIGTAEENGSCYFSGVHDRGRCFEACCTVKVE